MSYIIPEDVQKHESVDTINSAVSILKNLKGKTALEIERICQTVKIIAKSNATL